jgi:hypothetical protein
LPGSVARDGGARPHQITANFPLSDESPDSNSQLNLKV